MGYQLLFLSHGTCGKRPLCFTALSSFTGCHRPLHPFLCSWEVCFIRSAEVSLHVGPLAAHVSLKRLVRSRWLPRRAVEVPKQTKRQAIGALQGPARHVEATRHAQVAHPLAVGPGPSPYLHGAASAPPCGPQLLREQRRWGWQRELGRSQLGASLWP